MANLKSLWKVWLLVLVFGGVCWGQVNTGTISGTVRDTTGAVMPGANVVVLNDDTGISRNVVTDANGRYFVPLLNLGNYRVTGSSQGFQPEVRTGIVLTVGREEVVDLSLGVGAVSQAVSVNGEAPLVDSTTASLGSLVDSNTIRALPLNGRSYDQIALLQPGVVLTAPGTLGGVPFQLGTGKRFTVGGQRAYSNSFLLDGTNINDQGNGTPGGAAGVNLGVDAVLEFKIFTNSFKAEYGRSTGSVVSAVTRSGSNAVHGTVFEYIRNSAFDAKNYFDVGSSPPSFKRNQFGGVVGAPIKKDKTFIFAGYEGFRQGQGTTQFATVPTVLAREGILPTAVGSTTTMTVPVNPAVVPYLNLYPIPNGRDFGDGTAQFVSSPTVVTNEDNFMVRVDHQLTSNTGVFARYTFDQDSLNDPLSITNFFQVEASRRQYTTIQANTVVSPKAVNSFRFAINRSRTGYDQLLDPDPGAALDLIPGQPFGGLEIGALNATGARAITPLGTASGNGPANWAFNIFQWGDDYTYVHGKHTFKAGVDIERMRDNNMVGNALNGAYTFPTLNAFLAGTPSNLTASSPLGVNPYFGLRQSTFGIYGQDDYKINSRLTLNLGLRWEMSTDPVDKNGHMAILPSPMATATVVSSNFFSVGKNNYGPRFGLAWQLDSSGKTVLRVGGGIYYNLILPWAYFFQTSVPPYFTKFSISNPPFPNGYQLLKAGASTTLKVMAPFDKTPADDQYNLSFERQISRNTALQLAYAGNHANHLETVEDADTPIPVICPASPCPVAAENGTPFAVNVENGQPYYPVGSVRRNTAWNGILLDQMNGNSEYNSFTITLRHQSSSGFQGEIFYTLSKSLDDTSNASSSESVRAPSGFLDPDDPSRDWGLSEFDSRNDVGFNFAYPLPFRLESRVLGGVVNGWALQGIGTFTAGLPLTPRLATAVSRNLDSQFAERPNLNPGFSSNPTSGVSAGCPGFAAGTPVGNATNWYDPCAFSVPLAGTYGDLGRDTIIGPGLSDVDLALQKSFQISERAKAALKFEMFNIFNHPNFGLPNTTALASSGAASPSAGVITYTTTSSRQIQFALRISF